MQDIIDTTFKDCTVLAIMHQLTHASYYDKVALLSEGRLMEFDTPTNLLGRESMFSELYRAGSNA